MKKILLVAALAVLMILSGCKAAGLNSCNITHTGTFAALVPGASYIIIYQYASPPIFLQRTANSSGAISVPSYGYPCTSLLATALTRSNLSLSASPSSVNLQSPPATATVTGQSFDTTYGMPQVDYFDSNGYLVGSVYANSVSGGGTSLQANVPDLSYVYSGTYQVQVTNKTSDGYYAHIVGSAPMTAWGRDRTDSDGDGWYDDEDCNPYDPYYTNNCGGETCGGYGNVPLTLCEPL